MKSNSRKVLVPLATLLVAAAVTIGSGATWTSSSQTSVDVTAGTLIHSNNKDGMTFEVTKLEPGKTVSGTVKLKNTGDLASKLTVEQTSGAKTFTDNLTLTITEVDAAGATVSTLVPAMPFPTAVQDLGTLDSDFAAGESHYYKADITLVDGAGVDADQGKTAAATFKFTTVPVDSNTRSPAGSPDSSPT